MALHRFFFNPIRYTSLDQLARHVAAARGVVCTGSRWSG
jgi:hypothetical protein